MNNKSLWTSLCRVLLPVALGVVILGVLAWWAAPRQTTLASAISLGVFAEQNLTSATAAVSPTSQIHSPNKDASITQKDSLTISGYAWDVGAEPPFLVGDPFLTVQRTTDRAYLLSWTSVVSATYYVVEEATDPQFSDPQPVSACSGSGTDCLVTKNDDGTYYYRVKATASGMDPSRYSNVVSVVIPWTVGSTPPSVSALSPDVVANSLVTVEVRIDSGAWDTVTAVTSTSWGGWEWSYVWPSLPEERDVQHIIQTRARNAADNVGDTDTITVTVNNENYIMYFPIVYKRWPPIAYAPTLDDIYNPDGLDSYTVSWSYGHTEPPVSYYVLHEATDADFTNPTEYYPGLETSKAFSDKDVGTYYYRVRGHNSWGPGEWSVTKSVTVVPQGYRDDFGAATTWAYRRGDEVIEEAYNYWIRYTGGQMYTLIVGRYDFGVASPMVEAPSVPYTIRFRVKVVRNESFNERTFYIRNGTTFGVTFGGNGGTPCPADRNTPKYQGCLSHYYRLMFVYDVLHLDGFQWSLKRIDYHDPNDDGKAKGTKLVYGSASLNAHDWNEWKIEVTSSSIKIYVNGKYLGQTTDTSFVNDPYFGVYLGSPDAGDTGVKWDWFEVEAE